jgi:hypothetical protein
MRQYIALIHKDAASKYGVFSAIFRVALRLALTSTTRGGWRKRLCACI